MCHKATNLMQNIYICIKYINIQKALKASKILVIVFYIVIETAHRDLTLILRARYINFTIMKIYKDI